MPVQDVKLPFQIASRFKISRFTCFLQIWSKESQKTKCEKTRIFFDASQ
jgi:hypothetical protein